MQNENVLHFSLPKASCNFGESFQVSLFSRVWVFESENSEIFIKFHVTHGVENGILHANFTLLRGGGAGKFLVF